MLPGLVMDGPAGKRRGHAFLGHSLQTHPIRFRYSPQRYNPLTRNGQVLMRHPCHPGKGRRPRSTLSADRPSLCRTRHFLSRQILTSAEK